MTCHGGPDIIEDNLVLCLDAANTKSYTGTGTAWNDLSGNGNNGTLTNGPTFNSDKGGCFIFDGSNDHVSFSSYSQPAYSSSSSFTWSIWLYPLDNSNDVIMGSRSNDLDFTKLTTNNFEYYSANFGGAMTLNEWQNICITKNGTSFTYYKNGSSIATQTSSITKPSKPFFIAGDTTSAAAEYSNSRISVVAVYNTALTAAEVNQNFDVLKDRFEL